MVMLVRALSLKADGASNFADVKKEDYYYEPLSVAKQLGIITGVDNGNFNPRSDISRQDMMVIIARALKVKNKLSSASSNEVLNSFSDASSISSYAVDSVAALVKEGIIQGDGRSIHPNATTTRAEAAVVLFRVYEK